VFSLTEYQRGDRHCFKRNHPRQNIWKCWPATRGKIERCMSSGSALHCGHCGIMLTL
jgi:hypothetical protein